MTIKDNTLLEYVKEVVLVVMKEVYNKTDVLGKSFPLLNKVSVTFPIFTIDVSLPNSFIATGTKDVPRGIAEFANDKGKFVLITDKKDNSFFLLVEDVKKYIVENKDLFTRGVGPDFETMGYSVKTEDFLKIISKENE